MRARSSRRLTPSGMVSESVTISSDALAERFAACRRSGRSALIAYLTAGHPDPEASIEIISAVAEAGADVIEIGVPFSDPMADGPVIQASSQVALNAGTTFDRVLEIASRAAPGVPLVLFSYLNPIIAAGAGALQRAADAGFSGILV